MFNTLQLTVIESLQSMLFDIFDVCGFGEVARPMINVGVDFKPTFLRSPVNPDEKEEFLVDSNPGMGNAVPNFSSNMLPGVIVLVLHFTAVGLTAG